MTDGTLADAIVRIGNDNEVDNNHLCALPVKREQSTRGAVIPIECWQPICGRYVSVHGGRGIDVKSLMLCDVMVYATEPDGEQCTNDTVPFDGE